MRKLLTLSFAILLAWCLAGGCYVGGGGVLTRPDAGDASDASSE
jgi:hypothetical protein